MRIGVSVFLIALGAILRFALETSIEGINLGVTGVILMVVGVIGLGVSLAFWSSLSPSNRRARVVDSEVVRDVESSSPEHV
jgi:hypothetical protein